LSTENNDQGAFISGAGTCIASRRIVDRESVLKWLLREKPVAPSDSGWRFMSIDDESDYINNPDNLVVCDLNTVALIEPAVLEIIDQPVGSDLQIVIDDQGVRFVDNLTSRDLDIPFGRRPH
jgi:hypothetical protein